MKGCMFSRFKCKLSDNSSEGEATETFKSNIHTWKVTMHARKGVSWIDDDEDKLLVMVDEMSLNDLENSYKEMIEGGVPVDGFMPPEPEAEDGDPAWETTRMSAAEWFSEEPVEFHPMFEGGHIEFGDIASNAVSKAESEGIELDYDDVVSHARISWIRKIYEKDIDQ